MTSSVSLSSLYNTNAVTPYGKEPKNKLSGNIGDFISAVITGKTEKATKLKMQDGSQYNFPPDSVYGEIGDEVFFEVHKNGQNGIELKQIFPNTSDFSKQLTKQVSIKELQELMQRSDFVGDDDYSQKAIREREKETQDKTQKAISKIRRQVSYAVNNTNRAAVAQLIASGINLEKISLNTLTEVVSEIETEMDRDLTPEDLPPTDSNAQALQSVENKINEISDLSDGDIVQVLNDDKPVTVENIYIAKFQSSETVKTMTDDEWNKILPEVLAKFQKDKIDVTPQNLEIARLLIANDIPLTKQNVEKVSFLKDIKNRIDFDSLMSGAVLNIKNGKNPADIELFIQMDKHPKKVETTEAVKQYYIGLIKDIPRFTREHIEHVLKDNLTVTLKELQNALHNGEAGRASTPPTIAPDMELAAVTAQRQLAEIQLRMTADAANRLIKKGLKIDTLPLSEALDALKALEKEMYARQLKQAGAEDSAENVEQMAHTFDKVKAFSEMTYRTFADITLNRIAFTISGVHGSLTAREIIGKYEESATVPNPKYGDSFKKVMEQMSGLLDKLNIEATEQNVKAAKILSRNNMDVTPENIVRIKTIDAKIETIYNRLHPAIAANMIKDGLKPSEMHIDEVISYIDKFNDMYGTNDGDKLSKYILEMDKSTKDWQENRESMMDIYRMLNQISKNDGAAIGLSVKTDTELTLGNLLNNSKIYRSGKANDYTKTLFSNFIGLANPESLQKLIQEHGLDISVEQALNYLDEYAEQNAEQPLEIEAYMQQLLELQKTPAAAIKFMTDNQIPVTLFNAQMMRSFLADPSFLAKAIDKLKIEDELEGTDLEDLKEGASPQELADKLEQTLLDKRFEPPDAANGYTIEDINVTVRALRLQNALSAATASAHIPLKLNGRAADVHMYVVNGNIDLSEETNVFMSLNTQIGTVQTLMKIKDGKADLTMYCGNKDTAKLFEENIQELESFVNESGFALGSIEFSNTINDRGQMYE